MTESLNQWLLKYLMPRIKNTTLLHSIVPVTQSILKPTRVTTNSATLIDHVITNANLTSVKSVIFTEKISYHYPILSFLSTDRIQKNQQPTFFALPN